MTVLERKVEDAVASADDIRWVHGYLRGMLDGGSAPDELQVALENVYKHFRELHNERLADLTLDGLDFVTGWCAPGMEIPTSS